MTAYKNWSPTPFDCRGLNLPDRQDWIVCPCLLTRDSECLEESNWHTMLAILDSAAPRVREGVDAKVEYEVHHFRHWGPGWIKICLVSPEGAAVVADIRDRLGEYPVLDEDDFSSREHDRFVENWSDWGCRDVAKFAAKLCYDEDRAEEMIRNQESAALEWWMGSASSPYEIGYCADKLSRKQVASLLKACRAAQRKGESNEG